MPMNAMIVTQWSSRSTGAPFIVWPDGCRDLIVRLGPLQPPTLFLTGLDATAYWVHAPATTEYFGVRLTPGTLAVWESHRPTAGRHQSDLQCFNQLSKALLEALHSGSGTAPSLLRETVDRWFRPANTITREFFRALDRTGGNLASHSRGSRTLKRHIRSATSAPPRFWLGLRRLRRSAYAIVHGNAPQSNETTALKWRM